MELQATYNDLRKSNKRLNKVKKELKSNNTKIARLKSELKKVEQKASKTSILAIKKVIIKAKGK
jgi:septal ring factor EnvC (AmiA/AmiB activator)